MAKGVSIKFKSYSESVYALLKVIKLDEELKKHDSIILKPFLQNSGIQSTSPAFVEQVLRFCIANKNQDARIFIAEGSDGEDTLDLFEEKGYKKLAERYNVGLVDLNTAEVEEIKGPEFTRFDSIMYPTILKNSFVISLPSLSGHHELEMTGSLANMIGAFPAKHYKGFFKKDKSKIRKWDIKYSLHDILKIKMPNLAIIDASDKGLLIVGQPIEADKQAARALGMDWSNIQSLRLINESFASAASEEIPQLNPQSNVPTDY